MRKFSAIFLCVMLISVCTVAVACSNANTTNNEYKLVVPDGAPTMAVATLLNDNMVNGVKVNTIVTTGPDAQSKVLNGEADLAILPTNMSANLYNKGTSYKLVTVNVFGLLYLVADHNVELEDLKGKVVASIGKSNTPEYVFKKILSEQNIEYRDGDVAENGKVTIKYYTSATEILPLLLSGTIEYALLGEPAVSKALSMDSSLKIVADLQQLWGDATQTTNGYPQAGLVVSQKLLSEDINFVNALIQRLEDNQQFLLNNTDNLAQLFKNNGSNDLANVAFNKTLIERCNVTCVTAKDAYQSLVEYFETLYNFNPASVGNKLPDNDFYYGL